MRTLIAFAGDYPGSRRSARDAPSAWSTPMRSSIAAIAKCPAEVLDRTFSEIGKYDDFVLVRDIAFNSHCEHHMMPFMGKAHIAYKPVERVVGLSKLARLVDVYARRLQTQEHMTSQIATAIEEILKPRGVAVMLEAEHMCMSVRGVEKPGSSTITTQFIGSFRETRTSRCASSPWCAGLTADPSGVDLYIRALLAAGSQRDVESAAAGSGRLPWLSNRPLRHAARPRRSRKALRLRRSSMPTGSSPASRPTRRPATC